MLKQLMAVRKFDETEVWIQPASIVFVQPNAQGGVMVHFAGDMEEPVNLGHPPAEFAQMVNAHLDKYSR